MWEVITVYIDVNQAKQFVTTDNDAVINLNGEQFIIKISTQKTGFGAKSFMLCPRCNTRRAKLYWDKGEFICRECSNVNIYQMIKNTRVCSEQYIRYRMIMLGKKYGIKLKEGRFHYYDYPKPKYKHTDVWCEKIAILQGLENLRLLTLIKGHSLDKEIVDSIINKKNYFLYLYDLEELDECIINWEAGVMK